MDFWTRELHTAKGLPPPLRATSQYHLPLGTPTQQQMPMGAAMGGVPTADGKAVGGRRRFKFSAPSFGGFGGPRRQDGGLSREEENAAMAKAMARVGPGGDRDARFMDPPGSMLPPHTLPTPIMPPPTPDNSLGLRRGPPASFLSPGAMAPGATSPGGVTRFAADGSCVSEQPILAQSPAAIGVDLDARGAAPVAAPAMPPPMPPPSTKPPPPMPRPGNVMPPQSPRSGGLPPPGMSPGARLGPPPPRLGTPDRPPPPPLGINRGPPSGGGGPPALPNRPPPMGRPPPAGGRGRGLGSPAGRGFGAPPPPGRGGGRGMPPPGRGGRGMPPPGPDRLA